MSRAADKVDYRERKVMRTLLMSPAPVPHPDPALHSDSDDSLLREIARSRSRPAFAILLGRYQRDAFNLAYHLTGRRELAEEAVQEAMLQLWRSASAYRPGAARGWILRLVANASLKCLRKQRRHERKMSSDIPRQTPGSDPARDQLTERAELLDAIQQVLEELAPLHRRLVALYFGAGFTHQEIGRELALPTRTVSYKLDETLKQLRGRLLQSGFATAVPLVSAEGLCEAVTAGYPPPPGMAERITKRIESAGNSAVSSTAEGTAFATHGLWSGLLGGLATLVAAAAALWWGLADRTEPDPASVQPPTLPAAPQPEAARRTGVSPSERGTPINLSWSFQDGPVRGLAPHLVSGSWAWRKVNGKGCMVPAGKDQEICLLFPIRIPAGKLLLTLDVIPGPDRNSFDPYFANRRELLPYTFYYHELWHLKRPFHRIQACVLGEYVITMGEFGCVKRYEKPHPGERILLRLMGWQITRIEIREVPEGDPALAGMDPHKEIERIMSKGYKTGFFFSEPLDPEWIPLNLR